MVSSAVVVCEVAGRNGGYCSAQNLFAFALTSGSILIQLCYVALAVSGALYLRSRHGGGADDGGTNAATLQLGDDSGIIGSGGSWVGAGSLNAESGTTHTSRATHRRVGGGGGGGGCGTCTRFQVLSGAAATVPLVAVTSALITSFKNTVSLAAAICTVLWVVVCGVVVAVLHVCAPEVLNDAMQYGGGGGRREKARTRKRKRMRIMRRLDC